MRLFFFTQKKGAEEMRIVRCFYIVSFSFLFLQLSIKFHSFFPPSIHRRATRGQLVAIATPKKGYQ
jgi:hypothetical protein